MRLEIIQNSNVLLGVLYGVKEITGSSNLIRKVVDCSLVQLRVFAGWIVVRGSFSFGSSNHPFYQVI